MGSGHAEGDVSGTKGGGLRNGLIASVWAVAFIFAVIVAAWGRGSGLSWVAVTSLLAYALAGFSLVAVWVLALLRICTWTFFLNWMIFLFVVYCVAAWLYTTSFAEWMSTTSFWH